MFYQNLCPSTFVHTESPSPEAQQEGWKSLLTASPALHPGGGWLTSAPAVSPTREDMSASPSSSSCSPGCAQGQPCCSAAHSLVLLRAQQQSLHTTQLCQILPFPHATAIWTQGSGALRTIPTWIHWFQLRINIPKGHRDCDLDPSSFHSKFTWRWRCFRVTAPAVHSCGSKGRIDHSEYVALFSKYSAFVFKGMLWQRKSQSVSWVSWFSKPPKRVRSPVLNR